jgi:hypothetical protein
MGKCYFCSAEISAPVYRSSECPQCGKDVKICLNCVFYSKDSHWECRESINEAVLEKDRSNYCDYFKLSSLNNSNDQDTENPLEAFNKLFGD